MNCERHQKYLNDDIDEYLPKEMSNHLAEHRENCNSCRLSYQNAIVLKQALMNFSVPEPDQDFESRMLEILNSKNKLLNINWLASFVGGAIAASILMFIFIIPNIQTSNTSVEAISINLPYQTRKDVQLVFNAPEDISNARFTIVLSDNIEIYGRPGVHKLSWSFQLKKGENLLSLPVISKAASNGTLTAKLTSGKSSKVFVIKVKSTINSKNSLSNNKTV